jgi:hypothetical protein
MPRCAFVLACFALTAVLGARLAAAETPAASLTLVPGDGLRLLKQGDLVLAELHQPWVVDGAWKNLRTFPLDTPTRSEHLEDGERTIRSDVGPHGTWTETITTQGDRLTLRYDFAFEPVAGAANLQWYWRLDSALYATTALTGEAKRAVPLTPMANARLAGLRRLDLLLPDRDLHLTLTSSDAGWTFRDVRAEPWAKAFRLEYNRPFALGGVRTGWIEVAMQAAPAHHAWQPVTADHSVALNGTWRVQAEGGPEQAVEVPGFLDAIPALKAFHRFTYRRQFDVPESMMGARRWLRFDAVGDAGDVYINGQYVGGHVGPGLPFEVDITRVAAAGSTGNTVEVVVRDDSFFSVPREAPRGHDRLHWVPRGMGADSRKGLFQNVTLGAGPMARLATPFITTAVRRDLLSVTCEVTNGEATELRGSVTADVVALAGGAVLRALPPVAVVVPGFSTVTVTLNAPLTGLERWQPDHPTLHTLNCRLIDGAGTVRHQTATRFGVRETWFDGPHFLLNGIRCNLRGESPSYAEKIALFATREAAAEMLRRYQALNCNVLRFHSMPPPPHVLDLCDEMGILVIGESAIYCSWDMQLPEHPEWLANCREHLTRWVRRDRNHPSIVLWSAENEALNVHALTPAVLAEFKTTIDAADGTRAVIFDGDGTAYGLSPLNSKHYVSTLADLADQGGKHSGYGNDLRSDIYWAAAFKQTQPLGMGEFLYPYEPALREHEHEALVMMGLQSRGYRYADWCDIRPYLASYCGFLKPEGVRPGYEDAYAIIRASFAPVAVFDKDYDARGPAPVPPHLAVGQPTTRTLIAYNDTFADEEVTVAWRLLAGTTVLASGSDVLRIPLGEHRECAITFTPAVAGAVQLELTSRKKDAEQFREVRQFHVE